MSVIMPNSQQEHENRSIEGEESRETVQMLNGVIPRTSVGRSNSAPHVQSSLILRQNANKSKTGLSNKLPSSPKKHSRIEVSNIPTLSDGVIYMSHDQVAQSAANVLSSQDHGVKGNSSDSVLFNNNMLQSSTPLCDTCNSSSSYNYTKSNHSSGQDPKPGDIWQGSPRKKFGRSESVDSYSSLNMPGYPLSQSRDIVKSSKLTSYPDGENTGPNSLGGSDKGYAAVNGINGLEPRRNEIEESQLASDADTVSNDIEFRRHPPRHPHRQTQSELILLSEQSKKMSLAIVKEKGYARLEEELMKAQKALEKKEEEVDELKGIRERLMKEVSDFTAALFEEVNSQLNEAAISEQHAKKQLKEANTKIDVLSAEVAALKDLVLTSTPSSPNKHLHPQINTAAKKEKGGKPFWKTHRRSTSHHQFTEESREKAEANEHHSLLKEMDNVAFDEFSRWRLQPTTEFSGQFFVRVQQEDIQPCLNFKNKRLADRLVESVRSNSLSIEPIPWDHSYPRKCCLSETHKLCNYKIRFEGDDEWYSISQMSRNRIAAVCDFYAYLRYIVQGLVKCSDKDMYAELIRLRNQMAQARLGLI